MARWHYPKWRRTLMQVVICLIFLASVGLAQWVVHDRTSNGINPLEKPELFGPISIRRPVGWSFYRSEKPVAFIAQEPGTLLKKGRKLTVKTTMVTPGTSAADYLAQTGEVVEDLSLIPITIGKCEDGALAAKMRRTDTEMLPNDGPIEANLIAGCVYPNGRAILIVLNCPVETPEELAPDVQLIRDIALKIQVQAEPGKLK